MSRLPTEPSPSTPEFGALVEQKLRDRAARLAERHASTDLSAELELISFRVGSERFALPLQLLRGVWTVERYTPVPGAAAALLGVIYVRGEIMPLVDLGQLLHSPGATKGPGQALLCREPNRLALAVDEVLGIDRYSREALQPVEAGMTSGLIEALLPDHTALLRADVLLASSVLHPGNPR